MAVNQARHDKPLLQVNPQFPSQGRPLGGNNGNIAASNSEGDRITFPIRQLRPFEDNVAVLHSACHSLGRFLNRRHASLARLIVPATMRPRT